MNFGLAVPILRMFDAGEARAFYLDYLGFTVDFEHRFDATAPLYLGVSRGACRLHLSQHYGDASPGAQVRIPVADIDGFHCNLTAKSHPCCRPGIELMPWGSREMRLTDPFANRLAFFEQAALAATASPAARPDEPTG